MHSYTQEKAEVNAGHTGLNAKILIVHLSQQEKLQKLIR